MAYAIQGSKWETTPEFLALTERTIPPGGRTSYVVPHPQGETETDLTSFVYGQASITLDKWPNFMYLLYPPDEWVEVKREGPVPLAKRDATGRVMYERFKRTDGQKRALLDFRGLPDTISTKESWWFFVLWRRLHPQLTWDQIVMRMELPEVTRYEEKKLKNRIQTFINRTYQHEYFILFGPWFGSSPRQRAAGTVYVENALLDKGIPKSLNTTRGLTPGPVDPAKPLGARIPHPNLKAPNGGSWLGKLNLDKGTKRHRSDDIDDNENEDDHAHDEEAVEIVEKSEEQEHVIREATPTDERTLSRYPKRRSNQAPSGRWTSQAPDSSNALTRLQSTPTNATFDQSAPGGSGEDVESSEASVQRVRRSVRNSVKSSRGRWEPSRIRIDAYSSFSARPNIASPFFAHRSSVATTLPTFISSSLNLNRRSQPSFGPMQSLSSGETPNSLFAPSQRAHLSTSTSSPSEFFTPRGYSSLSPEYFSPESTYQYPSPDHFQSNTHRLNQSYPPVEPAPSRGIYTPRGRVQAGLPTIEEEQVMVAAAEKSEARRRQVAQKQGQAGHLKAFLQNSGSNIDLDEFINEVFGDE